MSLFVVAILVLNLVSDIKENESFSFFADLVTDYFPREQMPIVL